jgi:carboxypeptidase Q
VRLPILMLLTVWFAALGADWQPLFDGKSLAGWTPTKFGGGGEIEVKDGALVLNQGILTGVNYTNPVPTVDYEVAFEARRVMGQDFFCALTFPVRDSHATLVLGGWGGAVVGISSLNNQDASQNDTTQYRNFKTGQWYRCRLSVTATNLSLWLDDEHLINADIRGVEVSLRPGEIELSKPFGIATWSTTGEIRDLKLRRLKDEAKPAPANSSGPSTNAIPLPAALVGQLHKLVAAATNSGVGYLRLAELCDTFGARPSGSTNLAGAVEWAVRKLKADGFANVRSEPVKVRRWTRGEESAELVSPRSEKLPVLGFGGTVATPPEGITAPVLVVSSFAELTNRAAEAKGRIVVFNAPFTGYGDSVRYRWAGASAAAKVGAVASVTRSVTPFSLRTPHTGMMRYEDGVPAIPHAGLAPEDAERLARMQARGQTPVLRLRLSARYGDEVTDGNVIAELPGRERPEEIVVVGGHFDSWDVGQGALDDGGGCVAAWEVLRLLKETGLTPRRTIRLVLWTNEEFGLAGANAYRDAHRDELARHVAAIETDNGTFEPEGFGFTGSERGGDVIRGVLGFLGEAIGAGRFTLGGGDADLTPLIEGGVPALGLRLKPNNYFWFHHTDADTVDKVDPQVLRRCTATLAAMVYALAEMESPLPR